MLKLLFTDWEKLGHADMWLCYTNRLSLWKIIDNKLPYDLGLGVLNVVLVTILAPINLFFFKKREIFKSNWQIV